MPEVKLTIVMDDGSTYDIEHFFLVGRVKELGRNLGVANLQDVDLKEVASIMIGVSALTKEVFEAVKKQDPGFRFSDN